MPGPRDEDPPTGTLQVGVAGLVLIMASAWHGGSFGRAGGAIGLMATLLAGLVFLARALSHWWSDDS